MNLLQTVTELSHEFGVPLYVKGGGGNTSVKNAETLWVKPSGTTLSGLKPESFVAMERSKFDALFSTPMPENADAREAKVKELMTAAVRQGQTGRPSVEAALHNMFESAFVVHVHPALINGLTCSRQGAAACARLFPEALWIPYVDPGFTLCKEVSQRMQDYAKAKGRQPVMVILENHGIFVAGATPDAIRATYRQVMDTLAKAYAQAGVKRDLAIQPAAPQDRLKETEAAIRQALGPETVFLAQAGVFAVAEGPLSPDHIIYAKSFPYQGAVNPSGIDTFRKKHGYRPLVLATPVGVFTAGASRTRADLAMEIAQDGALIRQLAAAFGGVQYMTDRARAFIENWEVESYRSKQIG